MNVMDTIKIEAEVAKLICESGKLISEASKLNAEAAKLCAETAKLNRERIFYPVMVAGSCIGALLAAVKYLM